MRGVIGSFGWVAVLVLGSLWLSACTSPQPAPVADRPQPPTTRIQHHVVTRGDSLHTIAWRYELDYRELATLNNLQPPYTLQPGQRLRLGDAPIPVPAGPVARAVPVVTSPISAEAISVEPLIAEPAPRQPVEETAPEESPMAMAPPPAREPDPRPSLPPAPAPSATAPPGTWQWPVTGAVTREYDAGRVFKGINIHSTSGTPVRASGDGTVVYAGSGLRGYGQLIILKHDDTYLSAYAHNNRILVAEYDSVRQGQVIGEVGGDPADSGRLYFEIREHGKPVDPEKLLPPR